MLGAFELPMPFSAHEKKTAWQTLPNLFTVLRILLIVPFVWLCVYGYDLSALCVFLIAGITDLLDGALARRFDQRSQFGRLADPLADKVLTTAAFVVLSFFREDRTSIPSWVTMAVIARDALILVGCVIVYLATRSAAFTPNVFGKANTFIELGTIVCFLVSSRLVWVGSLMRAVYLLLLASVILSASGYVVQGFGMLRQSRRGALRD